MKLGERNFNEIRDMGFIGLAIYKGGALFESGFFSEVLKKVPQLKDCEIISENPYFNEWVIRLE